MIIDIAIICPVEVEFQIIRKILSHPRSVTTKQHNLSFDFGQVAGDHFIWNIAVIEPELNCCSFELKTNDVIQTLKPKYVFLAGVAGGIKDVAIGDIVISTKAYGYESGKETKEGFKSRPKVKENESKMLLTLARRITRMQETDPDLEFSHQQVHFGAIASGEKVVAATISETYKIIKDHYNDSLAIEMEAYAFALVAGREKISYLNIRGISDLIDGKSKADQAGSQQNAAQNVAIFLKTLIRQLPLSEQTTNHSLNVHVAKKPLPFTALRTSQKGVLYFKEGWIELQEDEKYIPIRNIKKIEHVKMNGDFSKSWINIKYQENNVDRELYFSSCFPFAGWGAWFGGSKKLLKHFNEHKKRQVIFS